MPSRKEEKHEVLNLGVRKCFPRLRELLEHALYGSLELGSGGTAVSTETLTMLDKMEVCRALRPLVFKTQIFR